jgi:CRISPR system Cascade subunit CasC
MLIEIHILQNHAPSNLNRDDTGSPKECIFGGSKRGRISSQCLKRTIRRSDLFQRELAGHLATRTRRLPELVEARFLEVGISKDMAEIAAQKASGFGTKEGKEREPNKKTGDYETAQTMFLTEGDIHAVTETLRAAAADKTATQFKAMKAADLQAQARSNGFRPISVDVALFGRMTTSEAFRDVDAACQVAHALSTNKVDHEFDYVTAVDDLQGLSEEEEDAGADMIGDVEFNSACYYKYFSVDFGGLVDNLTGRSAFRKDISPQDQAEAQTLAARTVDALLRAAVLVTPTGKQNSFAAHQLPAAVLIEVRPVRTPVSYANAFVQPARPGKGDDLVEDSLRKLAAHVQALTAGFSLSAGLRLLLSPEHHLTIDGVTSVPNLNALCSQLTETLTAADGRNGAS